MKVGIEKLDKKSLIEYVVTAIIVLMIIALFLSFRAEEFSYKRFETSTLDYIKGRVVKIADEDLEDREQYKVGQQTVRVKLLEGELKGEEIEIENYISATHNIILKQGYSLCRYARGCRAFLFNI